MECLNGYEIIILKVVLFDIDTIKGGSRRAEKSCKVLMMMKLPAWGGQEQERSREGRMLNFPDVPKEKWKNLDLPNG